MSTEHSVVWDEGMLLVPQHFQQWDRATRALIRDRIGLLHPRGWGLTRIEVDEESLRGGQFRLNAIAGVLRSGIPFRAPERDPLPASRTIGGAFDGRAARLTVHLGLPHEQLGSTACGDDVEDSPGTDADGGEGAVGSAASARVVPTTWRRRVLELPDANVPTNQRDVPVAVPNLRVLLDGEPLEEYETFPIAQVTQSPTGGFDLVREYIPPCLHLGASPVMVEMLQAMVEMLSRKSEDLAGQQRGSGGMAEAATLWMRHTLNSHLPTLFHFQDLEQVHPEAVYLELCSLAGTLCTFADGAHPRTLPRYTHEDLTTCVAKLRSELRVLLGSVIPNRCVPIPLERPSDSLFAASVADATVLSGQLYLSVLADIDEDRLVQEFPAKAKITSRELVQQLLMRAVPGLPVRHVPTPPSDIPLQPGRQYFRLDKEGEHWDAIQQSLSLALHLPPDFPGLKIELMAVKEGS